jgi:predicted transcriptional regulator
MIQLKTRRRHFSPEQLQELVVEVLAELKAQGVTQADVAEELGVAQAAVSQAANKPGTRFDELQRRIIERYTGVTFEKSVEVRYSVNE